MDRDGELDPYSKDSPKSLIGCFIDGCSYRQTVYEISKEQQALLAWNIEHIGSSRVLLLEAAMTPVEEGSSPTEVLSALRLALPYDNVEPATYYGSSCPYQSYAGFMFPDRDGYTWIPISVSTVYTKITEEKVQGMFSAKGDIEMNDGSIKTVNLELGKFTLRPNFYMVKTLRYENW